MTPEKIIELAREAGFVSASYHGLYMSRIERFAALVAAHEREACAKLCEKYDNTEVLKQITLDGVRIWKPTIKDCIAGIRDRK